MGTVLKMLIAMTCVAVIAVGGYFVWRDQQAQARQAEQDQQAMCNLMLSELRLGEATHDWRSLHVYKCVTEGYLRKGQFDTAKLQEILAQAIHD